MNKKRLRKDINKLLKQSSPIGKVIICVVLIVSLAIIGLFAGDRFSAEEKDNIKPYNEYPFTVSFIDVDQGDCALISCEGINILVDGGEASSSGKVLNYLDEFGVDKLDGYIATHPHSDHIGATAGILNSIPCDKVFTTYFSEFNIPTSKVYEKFLDAVYDSSAEVIAVEAEDVYTFGDLKLNILAPIVESDEYNDMSIVFVAEYKDTRVLFTGDATVNVEKQILEKNYNVEADVIKIAHHGSTTSNSSQFLNKVSPEFAVISCGQNNTYGHPHKEVIDRLNNKQIEYLRTDINGDIICYGDGHNFKVEAVN